LSPRWKIPTPDNRGLGRSAENLLPVAENVEEQLLAAEREVDIAIRLFRAGVAPPDSLIGRRISAMTASA
jgi:hypothetical protein